MIFLKKKSLIYYTKLFDITLVLNKKNSYNTKINLNLIGDNK